MCAYGHHCCSERLLNSCFCILNSKYVSQIFRLVCHVRVGTCCMRAYVCVCVLRACRSHHASAQMCILVCFVRVGDAVHACIWSPLLFRKVTEQLLLDFEQQICFTNISVGV